MNVFTVMIKVDTISARTAIENVISSISGYTIGAENGAPQGYPCL